MARLPVEDLKVKQTMRRYCPLTYGVFYLTGKVSLWVRCKKNGRTFRDIPTPTCYWPAISIFFFCKNPRGHLVLNSAGEVWEMICSEGAEVSWYKLVWISEHIPWCIFIPCLALGIDRIPRTGYSFGSQVPQVCYAPCTFSSGVWANWRDQLEWTTPWMSGRILQGIYEPQLDRNLHGAL